MSTFPPFAALPMQTSDAAEARELATGAGVHGIYLANALHAEKPGRVPAEVVVVRGTERLLGLAYFGPRGNLLVVEREPVEPQKLAGALLDTHWPWRIALGPAAVAEQLVVCGGLRTLVDREQIYYSIRDAVAPDPGVLRRAERADLKPLMEASLRLNESDLRVAPWRVDRDWLRRATKQRIREGTTFVIGPPGSPWTKLDLGSVGPSGAILEGVFTWPQHRGRGLAAQLVAAVAAELLRDVSVVCLHVAADNAAARRTYEKAGMQVAGSCRLLLRD
ncbi:MAG: GNAT family N-acetyltransferase [Planctomycetes bacterium]|nr:GNAT family N-acetyltransferase [Planctomycetota bacterium]MCB9869614.1 GNAT family N-acetyltransferase [Planctomycetota bacterium]